jgi:hypothetical protein
MRPPAARIDRRWTGALVCAISCATVLLTGQLVSSARAQVIKWTMPTQREDDTPLALADLLYTTLYCTGQPPVLVVVPGTQWDASMLPRGVYTCYATVTDLAYLESRPSETVTLLAGASKPSPPRWFSVSAL